MAYRELELTLVSARELKNVNLITRMDVYAVVTISGDPLTRQCTAPDPSGGRNPRWDATLRFAVPPTAAAAAGSCLHVLLRAERVLGDRDIGEVVVPLADLLAGAPAAGPQQPQVASYQVRKVHRWEPRGVLNVAYRLGPVVAPVEAAERKPPPAVMGMAYPDAPVGVPSSQPLQPPADAYQPPPPPRPAAKAKHDLAPAPAPSPSPRRGKSNGLGLEGPTQVIVGPHTQIILGGGGPATTAMSSPTGSTVSSPRKLHGAWPKQELHHDRDDTTYASAAQSIFSPRKEDHSRPKVFPDHDAQGRRRSFQETEATSQRSVVSPSSREPGTVSPRGPSPRPPVSTFSSHGSPSSPLPYSPAHPLTPSPSSSAHSTTNSPYTARHPSTPSPRPLGQSAGGDAFGSSRATSHTNSPRSASTHGRAGISSPLRPSSSLVANHTSMVPSR
ncbi:hypothetical protein SEVIR_7G041652v4 [Setaria viridis]|nr:sialidase-like [Setaria viridis]